MNIFTENPTAAKEINSTHQIRLEYEEVFQLLDRLEYLSHNGEMDSELEQLRKDLDDACWLAQWKREYVSIDGAIISFITLKDPKTAGETNRLFL